MLGPTTITLSQAVSWGRSRGVHDRFIPVMGFYFMHALRYGVPAENLIGQASWETNDAKYTGVVPADYHNWCGLKVKAGGGNDDPKAHAKFKNDWDGTLAHTQHYVGYAGVKRDALPDTLIDPRFDAITDFADNVEDLGGPTSWAPDPGYGQRVATRIQSLLDYQGAGTVIAQIPGFVWTPADSDRFDKGPRRAKIAGGAQHYTDGKDSLAWLTTTSKPPVSANFLMIHNPKMNAKGHQLVRLEDIAWTTAFANQYTVSCEYEHDGDEPIPGIAYEAMAEMWVHVDEYIRARDLGAITKINGHKVWVGNPRLTCPDGIDVGRIVKLFDEMRDGSYEETGADPVTGKWIDVPFRDTFDKYGGIYIFGRPITGAFMEMHEGVERLTQYFERMVMRHFPEHKGEWSVQLDLLGSEELRERFPDGNPPA